MKADQIKRKKEIEKLVQNLEQVTETIPGGFGAYMLTGENEDKLVPLTVNQALTELMDYTKEEYMMLFQDDAIPSICQDDVKRLKDRLLKDVRTKQKFKGTLRLNRKSGDTTWVNYIAQRTDNPDHAPIFHVSISDINLQIQNEKRAQEAYELMHYRAVHDQLTGICNRDNFYVKVRKLLEDNPQEKYILIRWNIERFKVINDLFGVETGDQILKDMALFFKETFQDIGVYARLESDHFVLFYPENFISLEELLEKSDRKFTDYQKNYSVRCNVGVYKIHDRTTSVNQMYDRANLALQTIKGSYIQRYAFYDDALRKNIIEEQEIMEGIDKALREEEFEVFIQPIFSILSSTPESGEALIRWRHPQKGLLPPSKFIPLFERNGFITKLDYYVWEKTCENIHRCMEEGHPVVPISVNVSRINLYNANLPEELAALTEKYQVPNNMLKIEITESAYMDNPKQLMEIVDQLRKRGFRILMDDFGSGYSSLNMLKELPVDILKIDMKFIDDLERSKRAGSVVTSVVRMAKWLDMSIVAEGVETKSQLEFLRTIGCECVQGYYFAKPMPMKEFNQLISDNKQISLKDDMSKILENFDFDAIWTNKNITVLFNGLVQGMAFYELYKGQLTLVRANDGLYEMFGENAAEISDTKLLSKSVDQDGELLTKGCIKAQQSGMIETVVIRCLHKDGHLMWIECKIRFLGYHEKGTMFYLALNECSHNISPNLKNGDNMNQLKELLEDEENIVECARTLSGIHDEDMAINQVLERLMNYYQAERSYIFEFDWENGTAQNTYERCAPGITPEIQNLQDVEIDALSFWVDQFAKQSYVYIPCIDDIKETRRNEWEYLAPQNIQSLMAVPFYNNKTIRGFIGVDNPAIECDKPHFLINLTYFISNEIEKRTMHKQLRHLSYYDGLTGLYNRNRYLIFEENFPKLFHNKGVGIIFLDANGLKRINDSYGHKTGDKFIISIADMLKDVFLDDMLFRLSGDEFIVVCNDYGKTTFYKKVEQLKQMNEAEGMPKAAIGAIWEKNPMDLDSMATQADQQMYQQKQSYYTAHDRRSNIVSE